MFNMSQVGKTISALRKEKNMTQMELADRMGISFQAVSNWERGQTMPDIAKLGELAGIFEVTIDELLGNAKSARVVEKLVTREPVEEELSPEAFLDVAPLVKPKQAEELWGKVRGKVRMQDLIAAAPFLNQNTLDALVPDALVPDALEEGDSLDSLMGLVPFLGDAAVEACTRKVLKGETNMHKMMSLAPFLSEDSLDRLADECILAGGDIQEVAALAPFLGEKTLDRLAERHVQAGGDIEGLAALAPFLSEGSLKKIVMPYMRDHGISKLAPLLPFLGGDALDSLIMGMFKRKE